MTPKEAEEYYGKEQAIEIWEEINLYEINVVSTPKGIDLPKYVWEKAFEKINL